MARFLAVIALAVCALPTYAIPPGFVHEEMVTGLDQPVAMAFAPDGRLFVCERTTGRVRVIDAAGVLSPSAVTRLQVATSGERGLLGIALDPQFEENQHLYVLHTRVPTLQRITRFTITADNRALEETVIKDGIPASVIHNGGGLGFGPDGKLYFAVGDTGNPAAARRPNALPGKLHRINPDGSVPDDNPWPERSAFCLGCRNPFDFTFLPETVPVVIFASENGPTVNDEIHRIAAGDDCAWPIDLSEVEDTARFVEPVYRWSPTTAPVGIVYYDGATFPVEYHGDLFFAEYNTGNIRRVQLNAAGDRADTVDVFYAGAGSPVFALAVAPDGSLWFSTSSALHRVHSTDPPQRFVRGNVDGIGGVTPLDAVALVSYCLGQGPRPGCLAAADVNADGIVNLTDITNLISLAYGLTTELPAPFPSCGLDPTTTLDCTTFPLCK